MFSNIFNSIYVNLNGFRANRYKQMKILINVHRDLTGMCILPKGLSTEFCVQKKFLTCRFLPSLAYCSDVLQRRTSEDCDKIPVQDCFTLFSTH